MPFRRNKYNAKKTYFDDILFDSKAEAHRYAELRIMERAGKIKNIKRQVPFPLTLPNGNSIKTPTGRVMKYVTDFSYDENGKTIYEDVKGFFTKESRLKIAIVEACYEVTISIVK